MHPTISALQKVVALGDDRLSAWDIPARVLLAPLIGAQAIYVLKRAVVLPEPAGARCGHVGTGPSLRVLIIGDSSAAGVGAATQGAALAGQLARALAPHFSVSWRLEAETGATTSTTLAKIPRLEPLLYDIAILALGVNDVTRAVTLARWTRQQVVLHQRLRNRFKTRHIFASGLPPMGMFPLLPQPLRWVLGQQAKRLDRALATLAQADPGLSHIPFDLPQDRRFFASDGYHPNAQAYALWADILARRIISKAVLQG